MSHSAGLVDVFRMTGDTTLSLTVPWVLLRVLHYLSSFNSPITLGLLTPEVTQDRQKG